MLYLNSNDLQLGQQKNHVKCDSCKLDPKPHLEVVSNRISRI